MRKTMIILAMIVIGMLIPVGFATSDTQVVITYGETTHHNADYKNTVNDFFVKQAGVDLHNIDSKIITAEEVIRFQVQLPVKLTVQIKYIPLL